MKRADRRRYRPATSPCLFCVLLAATMTIDYHPLAVLAFATPRLGTIRISTMTRPSSVVVVASDDGCDEPSSPAVGAAVVSKPADSDPTTTTTITTMTKTKTAAAAAAASSPRDDDGRRRPEEGGTTTTRRTLGSQELLMLPRQYGPKHLGEGGREPPFPSMSHASASILSATPSIDALSRAVDLAMTTHPLLRCVVEGTGEPDDRIDLLRMVRRGDPDPCAFVVVDDDDESSSSGGPRSSSSSSCRRRTSEDVLRVVDVDVDVEDDGGSADAYEEALERSWRENFARDIDDGSWYERTRRGDLLWKLTLHRLRGGGDDEMGSSSYSSSSSRPCALVFSSNHAISDQGSVNMLMDQLLSDVDSIERDGDVSNGAIRQEMPMAVEDSVLGKGMRWSDVGMDGLSRGTIAYVAGKALEGLRNPVILPDSGAVAGGGGDGIFGAVSTILGKSAGGESDSFSERRTVLQFRDLPVDTTSALLASCRVNGVSVTNALTAAMALTTTDFVDGGVAKGGKERNYKVLQSLDMRRFGARLDECDTVACMAGSNDLMLGPLPDRSGESVRSNPRSGESQKLFWDLAREGRDQTNRFIESDGPVNAVRVFDFAMTISDMNNLVDLAAKSKDSLGRAYSAGVANNGVYERQKAVRRENDEERGNIQSHGKYQVKGIYFGTPQSRSGCLFLVSTITVNGSMKLTFNAASPIVSEETLVEFADAFIDLLEKVTKNASSNNFFSNLSIPEGSLTLPAAALGAGGIAIHAGAWSEFFSNIATMKENIQNPQDFWDAINFWIFFAVGHPLLQPILWISDVLHGSPGELVGGLVPISFLAANILFIGATALSKEFRGALNVAALSAFLTYVGAGLDGQAGLGDFNLQLNDDYQGEVVRGCPAYDEVRRPSMDGFDLEKYQGKWYEQKFHDWTQFKEVYDTTLDIKLTSDKKGWIDDFGVKGPAPDSAKLSWDKSPVANGAHYFMTGRVDENDPPGILREKGFGVEFPNYIVDVKKDPETGEYTEAIQFQCLERGGVRVFEGINFMSRNPVMTEEELKAMHARAADAGMNKYGASEEQMHRVARRNTNEPPIDNNWQQMWRNLGVDSLLELLTESIEDGGR